MIRLTQLLSKVIKRSRHISSRLLMVILSVICLFPGLAVSCECCQLTLLEMASALQSGRISSAECIKELGGRSNKLNNLNGTNYHIFIQSNFKNALSLATVSDDHRKNDEPSGIYSGIPIAVKDNIDVKGFMTTAGTPAFRSNQPIQSASIIKKLENMGFIVVGKTNMHELAAGVTSNNYYFGAVRNPYDCRKFAGGSSGGSATAVAFGIVPIAIGTDTAGSVRIPASLSGVVGFRPTIGRYATEGVVPISQTFDTIGFFARSVADIIAIDQMIVKVEKKPVLPKTKYSDIRLGVPKAYFYKNLDPATARVTERFLRELKDKGVVLVYDDIPDLDNLIKQTAFPIAFYEVRENLQTYIEHRLPKLKFADLVQLISTPDVKDAFTALLQNPVAKKDYFQVINVYRPKLQNVMRTYFKKNNLDAIIFPTTSFPARNISGSLKPISIGGKIFNPVDIYAHNTKPAANAGLPGLTIPIGFTEDHLPIGIEIDGLPRHDNQILSLGQLLQKVAGIPKIVENPNSLLCKTK